MIFSVPSGSIPCVASLAITWVNLPTVGGQLTQMYQSRQWARNRHSVHGRTKFYRTNWTAARGELFHRCRSLLLDYSGMEGASSSFPIESSGLWKQELWHWVKWDIYEWYLLHHREAVLRGFIPCHSGITWASSMIFSEPSGSIRCVASLAITWVNLLTVGGQPTQMYQSRQWACNRHSVHGRTKFYRTGQ